MRQVDVKDLTAVVKRLCVEANSVLPTNLVNRIEKCRASERNPLCKDILSDLQKNLDAAVELGVPICQDTGMAVIFLEVGQEVLFVGGDLNDAINEGVRQGYVDGNLRLSIVKDPLRRENTNDNTPAVLHISIISGDKVKLTVAPKGFGSENMSVVKMFNPTADQDDIVNFVCETVKKAGSNPCPPIVVGVGIGGDFELCAYLSKKALCRDLSIKNSDLFYCKLEEKMLKKINELNIGAQGFGGDTTALCVNIESFPTHIAGLPVAVNIGCHVTRHKSAII